MSADAASGAPAWAAHRRLVIDAPHNRALESPERLQAANPQKLRTGLDRIRHAAGYSLAGLRAGWQETAFRQEAIAACVLLPLAFPVGRSWVEVALLTGTVLLVMIVELLNTCVYAPAPGTRRTAARRAAS